MTKLLSMAGILIAVTAGYFYMDSQKPKDPCQANQLKVSKLEVGTQDKVRLEIHMGASYESKVKRFLPHIKNAKSNVYFQKYKSRPAFTSFTTDFKSKRTAKKAYRYLKWKWKKKKKNQYDVILKDKTVTWFSNSRYTPQCFYQVVGAEKKRLGVTEINKAKKITKVAKKKKLKKKTRQLASVKKRKKLKKLRRKRRLASVGKKKI